MTSWRTNASTSRSRGQMWKGEAEVRICDAHDANEAGGEGPPLHQQHPFQPLQQSPIQLTEQQKQAQHFLVPKGLVASCLSFLCSYQPWWEKKTGRSKSEADRYSFRVVREGWAGHREVTPKYSRMAFFSYALLLYMFTCISNKEVSVMHIILIVLGKHELANFKHW